MKASAGMIAALLAIAAAGQPAARAQQAAASAVKLERDLTALQADLLPGKSAREYEDLRNRALQARAAAVSLDRKDLLFAAEAIATSASNAERRASQRQEDALPLMIQTLSDAAAALEHIQSASAPDLVQRFVKSLADVIAEENRFPVASLHQDARKDSLLKQIAAGVERSIPVDFHFTPRFGDWTLTVEVAGVFAVLSDGYGSFEAAEKRLSLAADRARAIGDPDLWASLLANRYDGERRAHVPASRSRALRAEARRASTAVRNIYRSRAGRIYATFRSDRIYSNMLQDQLSEADEPPDTIFAAVEALQARTLLDEMILPRPAIVSSPQASEAERRAIGFEPLPGFIFENDRLKRSEISLITQLSFFEASTDDAQKRQKALDELEALYRKEDAGFSDAASPAALSEIQQALEPHEAILEYVIPFDVADPVHGLWILFVSRNGFAVAKAPLDEGDFHECGGFQGRSSLAGAPLDTSPLACAVINLRMAIQLKDDDVAKQNLRALYILLIEPLRSKGVRIEDFHHLIVVPHGPLHYVPFAALRDQNGKYLGRDTSTTVAPSASVWRLLAARRGQARQFFGFANSALNHAPAELDDVSTSARKAGLSASVAQEPAKGRFLQAMVPANILHFATHGDAPGENAQDYHALILGASDGARVEVRASDIQHLRLPANLLTVLSVCDAGLYRTGPGNEPYGLMPAFLKAGAQNVTGTLWPLDDQFGRQFMVEFYQHLWRDGPAEAMRETYVHFIDRNQPIRNWAAFVLMGPGRPFNTPGSK
jgi:CHAT domain-containing protein